MSPFAGLVLLLVLVAVGCTDGGWGSSPWREMPVPGGEPGRVRLVGSGDPLVGVTHVDGELRTAVLDAGTTWGPTISVPVNEPDVPAVASLGGSTVAAVSYDFAGCMRGDVTDAGTVIVADPATGLAVTAPVPEPLRCLEDPVVGGDGDTVWVWNRARVARGGFAASISPDGLGPWEAIEAIPTAVGEVRTQVATEEGVVWLAGIGPTDEVAALRFDGTWQVLPTPPIPVDALAAVDGVLVVFDERTGAVAAWRDGRWDPMPAAPFPTAAGAMMAGGAGRLVIAGGFEARLDTPRRGYGFADGSLVRDVVVFDLQSNSWATATQLPTGNLSLPMAVGVTDSQVAAFGQREPGTASGDNQTSSGFTLPLP